MDGDRLRLPANRNCCRLSCVSWALLKLLVFTCSHQRSPPITLLTLYRLDIANFAYPLFFNALVWGDPLQMYGKAFFSSWKSLPGSRRWRFGDPILHRFWPICQCDRQKDGRTELRWLRCATAVAAVVRKNPWNLHFVIQGHPIHWIRWQSKASVRLLNID